MPYYAENCGILVDGYPCMRVPGHTGSHITIEQWRNAGVTTMVWPEQPGTPVYDNDVLWRKVKLTTLFVAVLMVIVIGFQSYIDTLVLIHWGWLCRLSVSLSTVSNARVTSQASCMRHLKRPTSTQKLAGTNSLPHAPMAPGFAL